MSVATATLTHRPPRRAMRELVVAEAKLVWREPAGLVLGVFVPVLLLVIFGMAPGLKKHIVGVSPPTTYMSFYVPVLIGMVLTLIALVTLPIGLVLQRERAFLRRLSTTPVAPRWLLAAQVVVNLALALLAMILIVAGAVVFFHVAAPVQLGGFVLSALFATAALFAMGLVIAAIAPSERAAGVLGTVLLYPLLFFAGLWTPKMSGTMHRISNFTPLGAAVHAMLSSMHGTFPSAEPLLVMAGYAVVLGFLAVRLFRWE